MPSDQLYNDPGLVEFYDIENGWTADSEYLKTMAAGRASILDLGCGTGMLTAALAERASASSASIRRPQCCMSQGRGPVVTGCAGPRATVGPSA